MAIYLGLDSSTQSLTAVAIEITPSTRRVLWQHSLRFDEDFPEFGTDKGVLPNEDPLVEHSDPQVWVAALDRMFEMLSKESSLDLAQLEAIAGSGQQHGSVYLNASFNDVIARLDPKRDLVSQLASTYSRQSAPIWMDSSTGQQCEEIARAVGGAQVLADLTGSRAFERFTGPQIRKFWQTEPKAWENTDRIHLVSSFLATLVAGRHAPIDPGDGAGMNLMDLARKRWADIALEATAPGLAKRLPDLAEAWTVVSELGSYWVERYGFSPRTRVIAWSGDNPCSLIGVGLVKPGRLAISLGTSDTLFGYLPEARVDPAAEGHAFGAPTGDFMSLICFKNGSLAREAVRVAAGLDWPGFSECLRQTAPGNGAAILLPWFEPEITPNVTEAGPRRYWLDEDDQPRNVRGVIEGQMLSMALHSDWMDVRAETIYATGGAACNREILAVMADVHNAEVYQFRVGNSAALGAALRAYHASEIATDQQTTWEEIVDGFTEPVLESRIQPDPERVRLYRDLRELYAACERHALGAGGDVDAARKKFLATHGG